MTQVWINAGTFDTFLWEFVFTFMKCDASPNASSGYSTAQIWSHTACKHRVSLQCESSCEFWDESSARLDKGSSGKRRASPSRERATCGKGCPLSSLWWTGIRSTCAPGTGTRAGWWTRPAPRWPRISRCSCLASARRSGAPDGQLQVPGGPALQPPPSAAPVGDAQLISLFDWHGIFIAWLF